MTVRARVRGFDWTLEDASMDLGASPTRTFFKVTLPLIVPGIVAASMLSFALSLDDFHRHVLRQRVHHHYPLYVNAAVKAAVPPQINVLATAILVVSLALLAAGTLYRRKKIVKSGPQAELDVHPYPAPVVTGGDGVAGAVAAAEVEQRDRGSPSPRKCATSSWRPATSRRSSTRSPSSR